MPKLSPDQRLKIALALAFALYVTNGLNNSTSARSNRPINRDRPAAIALAAFTTSASNPSANLGGCPTAQRQVQVPADAVLNLRSYANGPVLETLASGATVTTQRSNGAWSQVTTASGQSGWAFSQYLGCR